MIFYLLCVLLFAVGLAGLLIKRNLIKIAISLIIMEYAIFLFLAVVGYQKGGTAPILIPGAEDAVYVDSLPQAVVLTAIVIGLGTTALLISTAVRIYHKYETFDIRKIRRLKG